MSGLNHLLKGYDYKKPKALRDAGYHGRRLPSGVVEEIRERLKADISASKIMARLSVSRGTITRIRRDMVLHGELKSKYNGSVTEEVKVRVAELLKAGKTFMFIREQCGVSAGTVSRVKKRLYEANQ